MTENELYTKAKNWFEEITEADVDLLIKYRVVTKEQIIQKYLEENNEMD